MPTRPHLVFACLKQDTADHYLRELDEIFQDEVLVTPHVFESDAPPPPVSPETVVLAAAPNSYERSLAVFPKEQVLLFERDISFPYYLDQLFLLPAGTRVLVVNELEEGAREVARQLEQRGVTHVTYIPYWENCGNSIQGISVALSPGMGKYCPPEITEHIDIKRRHLSVATFLELLRRLGLPVANIGRLMTYHSNLLFQTYRRLSDQHAKALRLQKTLQTMLGNMPEAVLYSEDGLILECNHMAEKLLRAKRENLVGKMLAQVLGREYSIQDQPGASYVLTVNKAKYLCTRTDIETPEGGGRELRLHTIKAVSELESMEAHARRLLYAEENKAPRYQFEDIVAVSPTMLEVLDTAAEMAQSPLEASVLITGESGTGKELFAQAVHNASHRANYPFVAVNFGAIPENLVESELFGYESGAFTGARKSGKKGLFEVARLGTIFLDEIGDASPYIQARLLRVLEEKELMRLGSTKVIPVDVRVIAATNRDLTQMCREGTFRTDLYHRLNTFPLKIPPLRERRECLVALIEHFQSFLVRKREFSEEAMRCILHYAWPGNARELKNMIDFLTLKPGTERIELRDLPNDIRDAYAEELAQDIHDDIVPDLLRQVPVETLHAFLALVCANPDRPLGRAKLIARLAEQGITISEAKCRSLAGHMAQKGLLEKRRTKQGTRATAKAAAVLEYLRRNRTASEAAA
ncbi:sigma 54-interacting transcriptional regulator [Desulfovibrio sp. OttesenSCG-928-O18]|nr:sigma 54-interacting transcriptional regulator [Desulfovibrio sp. OttesenSCG-928-O18]